MSLDKEVKRDLKIHKKPKYSVFGPWANPDLQSDYLFLGKLKHDQPEVPIIISKTHEEILQVNEI